MLTATVNPAREPSRISIIEGDILDIKADYLVSSGNPWLNMSGGVNGALLQRYGETLQVEIHHHLAMSLQRSVAPGFCYRWEQPIGSYKGVVYCVGIDAFYDSSRELVSRTLMSGFEMLAPKRGESVAFPAIGTGYGHLSKGEFGAALREVAAELLSRYPGTDFYLVDRNSVAVDELKESSGLDGNNYPADLH